MCEARSLSRCQLWSNNLLSDLAGAGANRPVFHNLLNSCAFAACLRPLHTSMSMMWRGFCAGWSPRSLQDVRLHAAGASLRNAVLCERTHSFYKGHRNLTVWPNVALVEGWTPATREAGWQLGSYRDLSAESYPSYVDARARCEWKDAKYLAKHNWQVAADAGYPHQEGTLPWALPIRAPARDARAIRWAVVGRIGQGFGWGCKTGRRTWRTGRLRRISWLAVSDSKLRDRHLGRSTRGHRGNLTARPAGKSVPEQTCAFHAGAGSAWRAHIDPTGSGATNRERVTARCGLHCACSPRSSL